MDISGGPLLSLFAFVVLCVAGGTAIFVAFVFSL